MSIYSGPGVANGLRGQPTNQYALEAGAVALIPSGWWNLQTGLYCALQELDIITGIWRTIGNDWPCNRYLHSDGNNFRVANQSGCVIGALVTNAGSAYTSVPVVTDATTGATYLAIVGGAVNTSVTVSNGGSNYTYPPQVIFSAPGNPGIQATGHCTLSAGAVSSVTVDDQGAGYIIPPTVTFINDPREGQNGVSIGSGATAVAVLTGNQTVTGILVLDHGKPVTSLPTITPSGGGGTGAAATPIMCWAITGYTVTTSGTGYTGTVEVTGLGGDPNWAGAAYVNVSTQKNLLKRRQAVIGAALATTFANITATGQTVYDGGIYAGVPSPLILSTTAPGTPAGLGFAVGGINDFFTLLPA